MRCITVQNTLMVDKSSYEFMHGDAGESFVDKEGKSVSRTCVCSSEDKYLPRP